MPALSSIFIELGINTAAFAEGMNKATYQAKAGAQQISSSLMGLGSTVTAVGSRFGEFGTVVGEALGAAGESIERLMHSMGNMSGLTGTFKAGALGVAAIGAAAVTAGGAVVAMAIHTTEAAKRLGELSESTGIDVKELSGLGAVSSLVGVSLDSLARGMERMSRSALMAAENPTRASNAYRTLGISVTDASGHLKNTSNLFTEVAGKFSVMQDGAEKTALAMQIFGRAGAELIPVLNKGADGIKYWMHYAESVGAILDEKTTRSATAFREELDKLSLISEGVQNKLMVALLPALDHITQAITIFASRGNLIASFGDVVGTVLTSIASLVFKTAYAWDWWGEQIKKVGAVAQLVARGDFKAIPDALRLINDEVKRSSDNLQMELDALNSKMVALPGPAQPKRTGQAPIPTVAPTGALKPMTDEVLKYIETLKQETAVQVALAAAVGTTTQAIQAQEARATAETEVFKLREGLITKQKSLEESLAAAKASGNAAATRQQAQIEAELKFVGQEITELDANKESIIGMIEAKKKAGEDITFQKSIVAETEKIQANIKSLQEQTAAVFESAAARRAASVQAEANKLTAQHPEYDQTKIIDLLQQQSDAQYRLKVAEEAQTLSSTKGYQEEVALIQDVMKTYSQDRDIQLAGAAALQAAQNKVNLAWDQNALKFGTLQEKISATMNEISIETQNTAATIMQSFKTAFDGIAKNLAELVVTGKSNFKALLQSLETEILTATFKKGLADLTNKALGALGLGGLGPSTGKPDGSSSNPMYVNVVNLGALGGGGVPGLPSPLGSGGMFDTGPQAPGGGGGLLGGIFKSVFSIFGFGGAFASGGSVTPGVGYLVGEQGPEAFVPDRPGTIVPNAKGITSTPMMSPNINVHVHGATDPDTFRKASPQIATAMYSQMRLAAARNMGGG